MLDQAAFDVERTDPVASGRDNVVLAADEAEIPGFVPFDRVPGQIVVANPILAVAPPVAGKEEQRRSCSIDGEVSRSA